MADNLRRNIYITTNVSCNLDCIYCYEDKSSKETFDLEAAKQKLVKALSVKTGGSTIINLHGGEPFLVFKKIKALCEWLWEQDLEEPYLFFATTNGTLVHGEIQQWLKKNRHRFIPGLSLDGTPEMQNLNRSNSFDKIDVDFFVEHWPFQGVKMTVSPKTIKTLADGIIYLHQRGIHNILVNLAYLVDWSSPEFIEDYKRELQKLAAFYTENPDLKKDSIFGLNLVHLAKPLDVPRKWCGAGIEGLAYDIDGTPYPCHLFFESVCGKEKASKAHLIDFSDPNVHTDKLCQACPVLATCPTCYGANYIERGDIGKRDTSLCKLEMTRVLEVMKYEYHRIVEVPNPIEELSEEEKHRQIMILEAIERVYPLLLNSDNGIAV